MAVATGQLGLLSRRQANGVGITNAQLRNRVTSGSLLQVGTDTFRLPGAPTVPCRPPGADARHRWRGLGERADRSCPLRLRRVPVSTTVRSCTDPTGSQRPPDRPSGPQHDLARPDRSVGGERHRVSQRCSNDDRLGPDRVGRASDRGIRLRTPRRSGSTSRSFIVASWRCVRADVSVSLVSSSAIEEVEAIRGGHSWLEREYLRILSDAGLPRPETQPVLDASG